MNNDEISKIARDLGYDITIVEDRPYLRFDFYSTTQDDAQDYYYDIVDHLNNHGIEFDDPYIEHDCISGHIQQNVEDKMFFTVIEMAKL